MKFASRSHRWYRLAPFIVAAAFSCLAWCSTVVASVQSVVTQAVTAADLRTTKVSIVVMDADTGSTLAAVGPDESMIPASNLKLVTTISALDVLGPDFVFRTTLSVSQAADGGVILIVRGDGDPAFTDPKILAEHNMDFDQVVDLWVQAVRKAGIGRVSRLLIDDRIFDQEFTHPSWPEDQLNRWYCAQVAGLAFNDNCLDVLPTPTAPGQTPQVTLMPDAPFIATSNRALTSDADTFWISRKLGTNELTFWGKVKNTRTEPFNVTVHDPPMVFGQLFADRLKRGGVTVDKVERPSAIEDFSSARVLHVVQTRLWEVVTRCNKDSQNLFAESLFKRMGRELTGEAGGWLNGAAAVRTAMQRRLGDTAAVIRVADGSGMSRDNMVTARAIAQLLVSAHRDKRLRDEEGRPLFTFTLAAAGQDGTLDKRLQPLAGRVYAKSGYINGVSALSGYVLVPSGDNRPGGVRTIAFSMLFNDFRPPVYLHRVKALQDRIVELLDEQLTPRAAAAKE